MEAVPPAQLGVHERVLDEVFLARRAERQDGAALRQHGLHEGGEVSLEIKSIGLPNEILIRAKSPS